MIYNTNFFGVTAAGVAVMPSSLLVAGPAASATHWAVAMHDAIPAIKRPAAAAPVASVNRGPI
jgi:3-dehydroquinate dehydratase